MIFLLLAHALALCAYGLYERQARYLAQVLDARQQWKDGHLEAAAALYQRYATDYPRVTWPVILFKDYPSRARAWYSLGRIQAQQNHTEEALRAFNQSMAAEPGLGQRDYRNLLLELHRYADLKRSAQIRLQQSALDMAAYWDLGASYLMNSEPQAAVQTYRQALTQLPQWQALHTGYRAGGRLSPEEADLRALLSIAYLQSHDATNARTQCQRVSDSPESIEHYDRLCAAYLAHWEGKPAQAIDTLKTYQPPAPEHQWLLDQLKRQLSLPDAPKF